MRTSSAMFLETVTDEIQEKLRNTQFHVGNYAFILEIVPLLEQHYLIG